MWTSAESRLKDCCSLIPWSCSSLTLAAETCPFCIPSPLSNSTQSLPVSRGPVFFLPAAAAATRQAHTSPVPLCESFLSSLCMRLKLQPLESERRELLQRHDPTTGCDPRLSNNPRSQDNSPVARICVQIPVKTLPPESKGDQEKRRKEGKKINRKSEAKSSARSRRLLHRTPPKRSQSNQQMPDKLCSMFH